MCQMQHLSCIDTQKFAVYNNFGFDGRATRVNFHNDSVLMVTFTLYCLTTFLSNSYLKHVLNHNPQRGTVDHSFVYRILQWAAVSCRGSRLAVQTAGVGQVCIQGSVQIRSGFHVRKKAGIGNVFAQGSLHVFKCQRAVLQHEQTHG